MVVVAPRKLPYGAPQQMVAAGALQDNVGSAGPDKLHFGLQRAKPGKGAAPLAGQLEGSAGWPLPRAGADRRRLEMAAHLCSVDAHCNGCDGVETVAFADYNFGVGSYGSDCDDLFDCYEDYGGYDIRWYYY